jgi:hypothetical protein
MAIKFFRKNIFDLSNDNPSVTVTDGVASNTGESYTDLMRNRNNMSGWSTTGSSDAGTTTMVIQLGDTRSFSDILLVGHNLKNYTLKYWDGTQYSAFSTAIAPTDNTLSTTYHTFTGVESSALQLIINGTQTANQDKYIKQFIITELLGTFTVEPEVMPQFDKDRKVTKFLSGKSYVAKSVGGFNVRLRMKNSGANSADLTLVETLFSAYEGFLVWICGGNTSQFELQREGYRLEDIFYMDVSNEYSPEYVESRWYNGMPIDLKLVEVS